MALEEQVVDRLIHLGYMCTPLVELTRMWRMMLLHSVTKLQDFLAGWRI